MAAIDDAIAYLGQSYGADYDAWLAAGSTTQQRTLVTATRYLDSLRWQGTAAPSAGSGWTGQQWPRSGVYVDGVELDSTTVPLDIVRATFELAVLILADSSIVDNVDAGSNVRSVGAGSARVEFFAPMSAAQGTAPVLPARINRLVGRYLAGAGVTMSSAVSTGTSPPSMFTSCSCSSLDTCSCGATGAGYGSLGWPL